MAGIDAPSEDLTQRIAARRSAMIREGSLDVSADSRAAAAAERGIDVSALVIPEEVLSDERSDFDLQKEAADAPAFVDAVAEAQSEAPIIASKQVGAPAEVETRPTRKRGRARKADDFVPEEGDSPGATVVQTVDLDPVLDSLEKVNANIVTAYDALEKAITSGEDDHNTATIETHAKLDSLAARQVELASLVIERTESVESAVLLVAESLAGLGPRLDYLVEREERRHKAEDYATAKPGLAKRFFSALGRSRFVRAARILAGSGSGPYE